MAVRPLPRFPDGRLAPPARNRKHYEVDFTTAAAVPAWLTQAVTWDSTIAVAGGRCVLTNGANASAVAKMEGPALDLSAVSFVDVTVRDLIIVGKVPQVYIGVGNFNPGWITNNGDGGFIMHRAGTTSMELRAAIASDDISEKNMVTNGFYRDAVTMDVMFRIDVRRKIVYGLVDGVVTAARDLSAVMVTNTAQRPIIATRGSGGVASLSGIEIDVWSP
ncbi:MAG: hypothetical protein K0S37_3756 [Microbacterium sp.]|jgi:hypothetical protein|nr:hypothetical protein [Microbacterium sp.]